MSKKALLVGINQFREPHLNLRGCVNDSIAMDSLLQEHFSFSSDNIKILRDADATEQNIRNGLNWLFSDYAGGGSDIRVFHFASHGTQALDQNEDEHEGYDEAIVTYDHNWYNPVRDDHLKHYFDTIPQDVNFTFIADCCHSGTMQRLPFEQEIDLKPRSAVPPLKIVLEIDALRNKRQQEAIRWVAQELRSRDLSAEDNMEALVRGLLYNYQENRYGVVDEVRHVLLAACQDRQTAADAKIAGDYRGAFTWGLTKAVREANGDITYGDLIKQTGINIRDYVQTPQLECPSEMQNRKFLAPLG